MIIFDLDGTLADCEHRKHFVQPHEKKWVDEELYFGAEFKGQYGDYWFNKDGTLWNGKKDWRKFYEACDQDKPIPHTIKIMRSLWQYSDFTCSIEIWSGRCESVREKTEAWLLKNACLIGNLKMRAIGDYTPDDKLKEQWLDEVLAQNKSIEMVFDDHKKVIDMWIRRGIFVFDVSQDKGNF